MLEHSKSINPLKYDANAPNGQYCRLRKLWPTTMLSMFAAWRGPSLLVLIDHPLVSANAR